MVGVLQFLVVFLVVVIVFGCRYDSCVHRSRYPCNCQIVSKGWTVSKACDAGEVSAESTVVGGVFWVTSEDDQSSPVLENRNVYFNITTGKKS